jgi:DNA-binding transcriptional LysR family regulator
MDRLEEWRMFLGVARLGSFVRVAEQQRRSPQAVTRAIAALEARVGARLFHRTTRSVSLSDEGQRYRERAERALFELERLEAPVDRETPLRGVFALTAPVLFGQLHVAPLVARFLERHPELDARLLFVDRVVSLADEGLDVGVRIGTLADSALRVRRVAEVRSIVCASRAYLVAHGTPRVPSDLARHWCIAFTATTPVPERWSFSTRGKSQHRVAVRPRLTVNTGQSAIDAALAGLGLVRVLSYQVGALVAAGKLVPVLASYEPSPIPVQLVRLSGAPSRASSAFLDFAAEGLRKRLGGRSEAAE